MVNSLIDQTLPSYESIIKQYPDYFEQALTAKDAAALIGCTVAALAQGRSRGTGPAYHRMPTTTSKDKRGYTRGPIRYIRRDVISYLQAQPRFTNTTSESGQANRLESLT